MASSSTGKLLQVYIETLEHQIANKKYFLEQTDKAIAKLKSALAPDTREKLTNEKWQTFLENPMFFPERSDPIGLSLASTSLRTRKGTSKDVINILTTKTEKISSLTMYQRQINDDVEILIDLLQKKIKLEKPSESIERYISPLEKNKELRNLLNTFVKEFLSIDLANTDDSYPESLTLRINELLEKLIQYDPALTTDDFNPDCKDLYRLLLKSNIIDLGKNINGNRYVKLLDFSDTNL